MAAKTLTWHGTSLDNLYKWLDKEGRSQEPNNWTITLLREYVTHMQNDCGYSPYSVRTKVNSLLDYTRWLAEEGYTETNVAERLRRPKVPQALKPPFADDQLRRLLTAVKDYLRDTALLKVMIDGGLRVSEVAHLRMEDVNTAQGLIMVREGKGGKDRVVPLSARCSRAINRYILKERTKRLHAETSDYVFLSESGPSLTTSGISQATRRWGRAAGVTDVHPHRFRHTFGISWVRNGGDIFSLQQVMGHSDISVTRVYVNMQTEDLQRSHALASPLTNLLRSKKGSK